MSLKVQGFVMRGKKGLRETPPTPSNQSINHNWQVNENMRINAHPHSQISTILFTEW